MEVEQWIKDFPLITRTWMAGALLTTAACALEILSPFSLYFSFPMIFYKFQLWRLVTNFFFFGSSFSLDFLFHMFFLVRFCRALEEGSFRNRTADFFYMIVFGATIMSLLAPIAQVHFLGSALTFMLVYVWARRNPFARMNFLGLFNFNAPYLPYVLLIFTFAMGNDPTMDLIGVFVGHLYYFLEDVYPKMVPNRVRLLRTPAVIRIIFESHPQQPPAVLHNPIAEQPAAPAAGQPPAEQENFFAAGEQQQHSDNSSGNSSESGVRQGEAAAQPARQPPQLSSSSASSVPVGASSQSE